MSDRLFFGLIAGVAALMIALALVWPQGLGARSPGPFGGVTAAERQRAVAKASTAPREAAAVDAARARLKGPK